MRARRFWANYALVCCRSTMTSAQRSFSPKSVQSMGSVRRYSVAPPNTGSRGCQRRCWRAVIEYLRRIVTARLAQRSTIPYTPQSQCPRVAERGFRQLRPRSCGMQRFRRRRGEPSRSPIAAASWNRRSSSGMCDPAPSAHHCFHVVEPVMCAHGIGPVNEGVSGIAEAECHCGNVVSRLWGGHRPINRQPALVLHSKVIGRCAHGAMCVATRLSWMP